MKRGQRDFAIEIEKDYGIVRLVPKLDLSKVYIEVTTKCNFDCIMCVRKAWDEQLGSMSYDQFERVMEQMAVFPSLRVLHFGGVGEPLCHENFRAMLDRAADTGLDIEITTNGSLLDRSLAEQIVERGVRKLTVSIDSPVEERYEDIRQTALAPIVDNLKKLSAIKKQRRTRWPRLGVAFVMMKKNLGDLSQLSGLMKDAGLDFLVLSHLLPHTEEMCNQTLYTLNGSGPGPVIDKTILPELKTLWPEKELKTERRCPFLTTKSCVISWDGEVSPCVNFLHSYPCYIGGRRKSIRKVSFGNVFKSPLTDIWTSLPYLHFRMKLADFRFSSCADCHLNDGCHYTKSNEMDCWANSPTCSDCLYARRILRCP